MLVLSVFVKKFILFKIAKLKTMYLYLNVHKKLIFLFGKYTLNLNFLWFFEFYIKGLVFGKWSVDLLDSISV